MRGYHQTIIVGHVGKEPESKYFANGDPVSNFSVAVQDSKDHTEWYNVAAYRKLSDVVREYVGKGDPILIEGRLNTREYQAKDGSTRKATDLIADRIELLGGKKNADDPGDDI